MQTITILGATGSVGTSTLEIIRHNRDDFKVHALTAHTRVDEMVSLVKEFHPTYVVMANTDVAEQLTQKLNQLGSHSTEVSSGEEALIAVSSPKCVDVVMAAIVGIPGLPPTYAAVQAGKKV